MAYGGNLTNRCHTPSQQQQLASGLTAMHHDLLAEVMRLQEQITHLEAHPPKNFPLWWLWQR